MEDHKVSRGSRVSVRNRYTVFLCEDDFDRLSPARDNLIDKLERHLAKHVRSKRYEMAGDVCIDIVLDTDLRLGRFGILAEREAPGFVEQDLSGKVTHDAPGEEQWQMPAAAMQVAPNRAAPARDAFAAPTGTRAVRRLSAEAAAHAAAAGAPQAAPAGISRTHPADFGNGGSTRIIAPGDAAELGLARTTIVIRSGNRVREYSHGRVIVGRAHDADFRIDNPDVSRRHAAIYWHDGTIMLEDLGSTNGTMVNGYPVSSTAVVPSDVIVIGDCRMNVDAR